MKRTSFIYYTSYAGPMENLSDRDYRRVVEAMIKLALGEELPELSRSARLAFGFIQPMMEIDMKKHAEVCRKNRENAIRGAKKRKGATAASRSKSLLEYEDEKEDEIEDGYDDEMKDEDEYIPPAALGMMGKTPTDADPMPSFEEVAAWARDKVSSPYGPF